MKQHKNPITPSPSLTSLEQLTAAETAPEAPPEDRESINGSQQLAAEATRINQDFSQQVLQRSDAPVKFDEPNPFAVAGEEPASAAFRCVAVRVARAVLHA